MIICTRSGTQCSHAILQEDGTYCDDAKCPYVPLLKSKVTIEAKKFDHGKLDWSLLPLVSVEEVIKVLEFGAKKYSKNNWQNLPDFKTRYINAMYRHLASYAKGEAEDPETGLSHMAHAACNALFLIWKELEDESNVTSKV